MGIWVSAIDACRQQMSGTTTENNLHGQSESSEQTTSNEVVPAFEEFIPMKRSSDLSDDDEEEEEHSHEDKREKTYNNNDNTNNNNNNDKKKSDWLRSVQLWHPSSDPPLKEVNKLNNKNLCLVWLVRNFQVKEKEWEIEFNFWVLNVGIIGCA